MIPETHADMLGKKGFAHLATIGPDGAPQVNPVWYDWDGDFVKVSQTKSRQKLRNIRRDPHVAMSILDPDNPYRYLEIRGEVERVDDDEGNAFINSMAKKYMDQDVYPWNQPGDQRVVLYVRPRHTTTMG